MVAKKLGRSSLDDARIAAMSSVICGCFQKIVSLEQPIRKLGEKIIYLRRSFLRLMGYFAHPEMNCWSNSNPASPARNFEISSLVASVKAKRCNADAVTECFHEGK